LGLSDFYRFRESGQEARADEVTPNKTYAYLDEAEIQDKLLDKVAHGARIRFYLPTIHCAACVWLLEKLTQVVPGILESRVSFGSGQIEITFDPSRITLSSIAGILNSIGYPPVPATQDIVAAQNTKEDREMLRRIGVAAVSAANTMMLACSIFQSFFTGMEEPYLSLFKWASAVIALPAVAYAAVPFYRSAIGALFMGSFHIDLPISIAIVAAYIAGVYATLTDGHYIYFDSVTSLIFLLLIARYIQKRAIHKAHASTLTSWDLFPAVIRVVVDGKVIEKPFRELSVGETVEVLAGERIPADGKVISGESSTNSAFLTGESLPVEVSPGSLVLSGSINIESSIHLQVSEVGKKTRLGKIISSIERGQSEKTVIENQANRLSVYFVGAVLGLSVLTFAIWWFVDRSQAFDSAIALMIVSCPCALGLAIPAAMTVALARAQKANIFVKRQEAMQTLAKADHLYFDKTGTLTSGTLKVVEFVGDPESLRLAKALSHVAWLHPISAAIAEYCADCKAEDLLETKQVPARGVQAALQNGAKVSLGSLKWLSERKVGIPERFASALEGWRTGGLPVSVLTINNVVVGVFALEDSLSLEVRGLVSKLTELGKKIFILSGDSQAVVNRVALELKIPPEQAFGDLYPEQKAEIISADPAINAMIGDGLNDAQAMRASDVGVGLSGGIEATLEAADIYVSGEGIKHFSRAYFGMLKTQTIIKRNLVFSVVYNAVGASAAMLGFMTPLIAAALMPLSSLNVILSSVAADYFGSGDDK